MKNSEYSNNLQYNSCISRGICSVNPRTSALQNVLGLYIHLCAKYCIKLQEKNALNDNIKNFLLNTIAISVYNPEFTEDCFMEAITELKELMPEIINTYNNIFDKDEFNGEDIASSDIFKRCDDIIEAIRFGEQIFKNNVEKTSDEIRNLFKIMLITAKSLSLNLLDLESYGVKNDEIFLNLLTLLNTINPKNSDTEMLKSIIYKSANYNTELIGLLHNEQEKRYGKQRTSPVTYTTTPSKAVLVVGSNIRELENILEAFQNTDIDVYTHDDMMLAHTFPKFGEYKNLKGQYGHGVENCLIDFATFPGPIILTKHSLHNIENLYRGRLYTTDSNFYKGVIRIEKEDFYEVIESANSSKGFKKGKVCETVEIGYDYEKSIELIEHKLELKKYRKIVVLGLKDYNSERKEYFENLIKLISDDILIISFSYNLERDNLLYFNACFDSYAVVRITMYLNKFNLPLTIFLPKCGRNTITEMIHFSKFNNHTVYMNKCEPIMIEPSILNTLNKTFKIKLIDSPRVDAKDINELPSE